MFSLLKRHWIRPCIRVMIGGLFCQFRMVCLRGAYREHDVEKAVYLKILGFNVLFRESLTAALGTETPFEVSELDSDLDRSRRELVSDPPDILLVDLSHSREEALDFVREMTHDTTVKILLVGAETSEKDALECMESGAKGYVPVGSSLPDLRRAIEMVHAGGVAFSPEMTPLMFARLAELSSEEQRSRRWDGLALTTRELEILTLIARGLRNRDLAEKLSLSLHTVKNPVHHILKKLNAPNRTEAVRIAKRHGWLK